MSRHIRTHKTRAIFAQELQNTSQMSSDSSSGGNNYYDPQPRTRDRTYNRQQSAHTSSMSNAAYNTPYINEQNENIIITGDNYKPNATLMGILGFNELAPFIESNSKGKKTIDSIHDNNYNDYNESGPNDINNGDYRQRLIKQMQDSMFKQSNAMFGTSEHFRSDETPDYNNAQNTVYSSSNAQAVYLQRQSKKLFKNMNDYN